jgi:hypothetical protein
MAAAAAVLALGALLQAAGAPQEHPPEAEPATHLLTGELAKVDLAQRLVILKVGDRDAREVAVAVDADTQVVSRGRVLRLGDLRAGDAARVLCVDKGGRHRARVVKTGTARHAVPAPGPRPPQGGPG